MIYGRGKVKTKKEQREENTSSNIRSLDTKKKQPMKYFVQNNYNQVI